MLQDQRAASAASTCLPSSLAYFYFLTNGALTVQLSERVMWRELRGLGSLHPHHQACDASAREEMNRDKIPDQGFRKAGVSSDSLSHGVALGRHSACLASVFPSVTWRYSMRLYPRSTSFIFIHFVWFI